MFFTGFFAKNFVNEEKLNQKLKIDSCLTECADFISLPDQKTLDKGYTYTGLYAAQLFEDVMHIAYMVEKHEKKGGSTFYLQYGVYVDADNKIQEIKMMKVPELKGLWFKDGNTLLYQEFDNNKLKSIKMCPMGTTYSKRMNNCMPCESFEFTLNGQDTKCLSCNAYRSEMDKLENQPGFKGQQAAYVKTKVCNW